METRRCICCQQDFPATTEFFDKQAPSRGGFKKECKVCRALRAPQTKVCRKCGQEKPATTEFFHYTPGCKGDLRPRCIACENERSVSYQKTQIARRGIFWHADARRRLEAIAHYSGGTNKCACCGEGRLEFLAFDHINGGGTVHRKGERVGNLGTYLYNRGYPEGYRILCHNCNNALGFYGYCPHEGLSEEDMIERHLVHREKIHKKFSSARYRSITT